MSEAQVSNERQAPWSREYEEVARDLGVSLDTGLEGREARKRLERHGLNRIEVSDTTSWWRILVDQFKNFIVFLLAVAAALSFAFAQWLEGVSIVVVIVLNTLIGFVTELKAVRSLEAVERMGQRMRVKVLRDGEVKQVGSERIVPGDVVFFEAGDVLPADCRLAEASRLHLDESPLTGESVPVGKTTEPVEEGAPLAERRNMGYTGTAVTGGSGRGIVTATGRSTELGRIARMAEEAEKEASPIEKRLQRLGHRLVWATAAIAVLIAATGIMRGRDVLLIVETAIALAVAAIPEGLPIVATIALARGMLRLARRNAVIKQLSAVETLGSANVICTDKTGTLTENRMRVVDMVLPGEDKDAVHWKQERGGAKFAAEDGRTDRGAEQRFEDALAAGVLCANANLDEDGGDALGDPMEVALLEAGLDHGMTRKGLLQKLPEKREVAFDPDCMMMATFHEKDDGYLVAVKGAPGAVLDACTSEALPEGERPLDDEARDHWRDINTELAGQGLRILGLARRLAGDSDEDPYHDLVFHGLAAMEDPPREEVPEAVRSCHRAGVRVIMVTGDQAETARSIARQVGLYEFGEFAEHGVAPGSDITPLEEMDADTKNRLMATPVFARVNPRQKLDLIALHQESGRVVAMTGDGVNDAPALKKADIGIAMGRRGTQVAREASDMVLRDDAFPSIVAAVSQGRAIFDGIRKFIVFLLSGNVGQVLIVAAALLAGAALPLLPLQILYLNMIGDVFPALALGLGKGHPSRMERPPRDPGEPILTGRGWLAVVLYGALIAAAVLAAFAFAIKNLGYQGNEAVTVSFLTLSFARLWHVFNMRDNRSGLFVNDVTNNPFIWGALVLCVGLLLVAVYIPFLAGVLDLVRPGLEGWTVILLFSLAPLLIGQAVKSAQGAGEDRKAS
ncbi:MAG: cation-translocating P-type ATPase [Desulfatibacillaceae bacterium]